MNGYDSGRSQQYALARIESLVLDVGERLCGGKEGV